jgi:transposase
VGKIYPEEVKKKAVQLYRLDDKTTYAEVGRDLGGISGETVRNWVRQADRDEGRLDDGGPTSDEKEELRELSVRTCGWRRRTGS